MLLCTLSIQKFYQNKKGLEFLNFQKSCETFLSDWNPEILERNKISANANVQKNLNILNSYQEF